MSILGIKIATNSNNSPFMLKHVWWNLFIRISIEMVTVMFNLISMWEFRILIIKYIKLLYVMLKVSKQLQNRV